MTDYVRARVPRDGGYDLSRTTSAVRAKAAGWEVLDEPTHTVGGLIRPDTRLNGNKVKPKTTVAEAATGKAASSASTTDNQPSPKE